MRLNLEQLPQQLKDGILPVYWVCGDEPLQAAEAADAIRAAARAAAYAERQVFFVDARFAWDEFRSAAQSLSLFSERRILELRMPTGKPGKGADFLLQFIEHPTPDTLTLILTDKLDRKDADAPWARAVERHGAVVPIAPITQKALPAWLCARARRLGLALETAAAELIAERVEGNLLAADQEITKLGLLGAGRVDAALVQSAVGDSARYDIYQMATAASAGDAARALHVLASLKAEGVEPTLILWAISRELRGLWQASERARLRSNDGGSAWNLASKPGPAALARLSALPLADLLIEASNVDRIIKGAARGDAWTALTALIASLAGALHERMLSGRVA